MEAIHTFSLVHDDLPAMDDDDLRRGRPSCHRAFDEGTAILAGDALQARAFELLASSGPETRAPVRLEMLAVLAQAIGTLGMAGGQAIDLAAVGRSLTEDELREMHSLKTGALLQTSVTMGAATGETGVAAKQGLADYGRALGLAFQVVDDILDGDGYVLEVGESESRTLADEAAERAQARLAELDADTAVLSEIVAGLAARTS